MGVTAFVAPGDTTNNLHIFHNKRSGNIGVRVKSTSDSPEDTGSKYGTTAKDDRPGIIVPTSHLDHTVVSKMRIIVGVVEPYPPVQPCERCSHCGKTHEGTLCDQVRDVAVVSPFYQKITTVSSDINSVAVAADDTKNKVWVFTLTADKVPRITSTILGSLKPTTTNDTNSPPHRETALSAYFNKILGRAFCYYQTIGEENFIKEYSVEKQVVTDTIALNNLDDDKAYPFTIFWAAEIKTLYLYYVDKRKYLQRMTRLIEKVGVKNDWSAAERVGDAKIPRLTEDKVVTQLTVVPAAAERRNNIIYLSEEKEPLQIFDEWPTA